jgi:hypothetical protein
VDALPLGDSEDPRLEIHVGDEHPQQLALPKRVTN